MRVFLFGVDGLTFRILHPMMERGLLPNFQRLREGGAEGVLESTTPPVTPPAWTSIATGLAPSKHGVYDFWEYEQTENGPCPHVMTHRKGGKAIWNVLSDWGKRVVVANIPITYPPEPVNGIMISGLMTPDMKGNITYPANFKEELLQAVPNYQIDLNDAIKSGQLGDVSVETLKMTRERNAMLSLLLKKPWDFFFIVYTGSDRIQHLRWDQIMEFHPLAVEYYQMVDEALGMALDSLRAEDMLMVVSDHGFQGTRRKFYLQEYLYKQGLLRMKNSGSRRRVQFVGFAKTVLRTLKMQRMALQVYRRLRHKQIMALAEANHPGIVPDLDWARTSAWLQSSSGVQAGYGDIYFDDSVTEEQINELAAAIKNIRDPENGKPLAIELHREDVFGAGPFAPRERHLIVLTGENIAPETDLGHSSLWETRHGWSLGIHHPDGVLYLYGAGVKKGVTIARTHVYDVVPTILSAMGVPLHDELDGKVMEEPFEQPLSKSASSQSNGLVMQKLKKLATRTT